MKILVTGGAGYLGSVMVPRFLQAGYDVVVLDNFMYGQLPLLDCCYSNKFTLINGDATNKATVLQAMKGVDAIFPLACLTGAPLCEREPKLAEEVVIDGLRIILENRTANQKIIYPTTNSGYGVGEKGKFCTEETPLRPISLYGKLKVQAEQEILEAGNGITLRLATAFGVSPRMRLDLLVNDFAFKAVHDGYLELFEAHFNRNFIHVRDIAKAFQHALENFDTMKNEPYNVGLSDANLNKKQLCEEIKKQVPNFKFIESNNGEDPDKRDYIVSNEKIEATGFKPDVSLALGIQELVKSFSIIPKNKTVISQLTNV